MGCYMMLVIDKKVISVSLLLLAFLNPTHLPAALLQPRMVQWFPGHIAKAERQLKTQLSRVDVILEIRDAR